MVIDTLHASEIKSLFKIQKEFSDKFFNADNMSQEEKESKTLELVASMHCEISSLLSSTNFKSHVPDRAAVDLNRIKYESVDVFRYLLAILNLWSVSSEEFLSAFEEKNCYLEMRHRLHQREWSDEPVLIVDIDDVILPFREYFTQWLVNEKGIPADSESVEYYHTQGILESGFLPEQLFEEFIDIGKLKIAPPCLQTINQLNKLHDAGFWIHLLTARPSSNLKCFYDTAYWLSTTTLKFHRIDHTPEKFLWVSKSEYYQKSKIVCAIDDSPKHSLEYAKHGIQVLSPTRPFNGELFHKARIKMYSDPKNIYDYVTQFNAEKELNNAPGF